MKYLFKCYEAIIIISIVDGLNLLENILKN